MPGTSVRMFLGGARDERSGSGRLCFLHSVCSSTATKTASRLIYIFSAKACWLSSGSIRFRWRVQCVFLRKNCANLKRWCLKTKQLSGRRGMSTLAVELHPFAQNVECTETSLVVELVDGRVISTPLSWFPSLSNATPEQLGNWQLLGNGEGIHWPDIDEDLSVAGLFAGTR